MDRRGRYPKEPDNLDILQAARCAYADDLAVASSSFRGLITALALAFRSVESIASHKFEISQMLLGGSVATKNILLEDMDLGELRRIP